MKKQTLHPLVAVAAAGALVFGPFAYGQDAASATSPTSATTPSVSMTPAPGGPGGGPGGGKHHGERMEKLAERLGLTDAQKEQLKPIFQDSMEKMKAVHDDTTLTPEAKHEKMKGLHEEMDQQLKSVLTPEQLQKMKELREEHKRHGFGGPGGGSSPAGAPPITTGTAQ